MRDRIGIYRYVTFCVFLKQCGTPAAGEQVAGIASGWIVDDGGAYVLQMLKSVDARVNVAILTELIHRWICTG